MSLTGPYVRARSGGRVRWSTTTIPYARILPRTPFGEVVDGDPNAGQPLTNIGVLISNGQAEAFRLDIDGITVA